MLSLKKYPSMQDISPREYMYFPKGVLEEGKPGEFSSRELLELGLAIIVLTFSFSLSISQNNVFWGFNNLNNFFEAVPISFFGIISAFFVHELMHKFMAQKYGLWSEFRSYSKGLVFSFLLSLFTPLVFAAPGAVMFQGETRIYEQGKIASAGPGANVVIAGVTLPLYMFFLFESGFVGRIVSMVCMVNGLLATFNLLPFNPLDGRKVLRWNGLVWAVLFIAAVVITLNIVPRVVFEI